MTEPHPLDIPEKRWRVVRLLLLFSPVMFAGCYLLALAQGAEPRFCLLIAAVGAAMCLSAALVIYIMGSKSWMALVAAKLALLLMVKR